MVDSQKLRLRVLLVSENTNVGGINRYSLTLAEHLPQWSANVHLVTVRDKQDRWLIEAARSRGLAVTALARRPQDLVLATYRLRRLILRLRPEIVHTNGYLSNLAARVARIGLHRQPALVATQHGPFSNPRLLWRLWYELEKKTNGLTDRYIACCQDSGRWLVETRGVPSHRVHVVPNGIEVPATERHSRPGRPLTFGFVGRFAHEKGPDVLLRAFKTVADRTPGSVLMLAGEGPMRPDLLELADELGLTHKVTIMRAQQDVDSLYEAIDVAVVPSRGFGDGIPLSLLEAMARRVPVVASRAGGIPEVIDDGVSGLLVDPEDPAMLAAALRRLSVSEDLRNRMGRAGRAAVEAGFTARHMVASTVQVYRALLGQTGSSEPRKEAVAVTRAGSKHEAGP